MGEFLIAPAIALLVHMTLFYLFALYEKDNTVADIAWGLGFVVIALVSFLNFGFIALRQFVVLVLVFIWGMRLAIHVGYRKHKKGGDWRYKKWHKEWGEWWLVRSFVQVYMLQGLLLLIISLPIITIMSTYGAGFGFFDYLGIAIWIFGFYFETKADYQLAKFLKDKNNKGKIMTEGLWKYSRHPNYFGEMTMWWGIWIMAVNHPYVSITVWGPILITFLLIKVSGIPMLQKKWEGNKEYEKYAAKTSLLIPRMPKK